MSINPNYQTYQIKPSFAYMLWRSIIQQHIRSVYMIHNLLEYEEGYREKAYHCSEGYPTIGIGKRIGLKNDDLHHFDFTCPKPVAYAWLDEELKVIGKELKNHSWFTNLSDDRRCIIVSMAYQMGVVGLFKFKNMIKHLSNEDYDNAATEALNSRWAKQTPNRANRHADVLRNDNLVEVYEGRL